jgi:hypothetical protein
MRTYVPKIYICLYTHRYMKEDIYNICMYICSIYIYIYYNYIYRYMKEDISGLFGKISRKDEVESDNAAIASDYLSELYQHVDNASRELAKFQADQNGKFKGLQHLVAAFVVEKNEEIEALKRNVTELKAASTGALSEQADRVTAAADNTKVSLEDLVLMGEEHREEEVARLRLCASVVSLKVCVCVRERERERERT